MATTKIALAVVCALALVSCSPTVGNLCNVLPITLDVGFEERLTRAEREEIFTANSSGEEICDAEFG